MLDSGTTMGPGQDGMVFVSGCGGGWGNTAAAAERCSGGEGEPIGLFVIHLKHADKYF